MRIAANIIIDDFGPPPLIRVEASGPDQVIHVGEAVKIFLPNVWIRDRLMPRITITLEVFKEEDQQAVREFLFLVQTNIDNYFRFWEQRRIEAETGIFMP